VVQAGTALLFYGYWAFWGPHSISRQAQLRAWGEVGPPPSQLLTGSAMAAYCIRGAILGLFFSVIIDHSGAFLKNSRTVSDRE
jgi:hypothetical protein